MNAFTGNNHFHHGLYEVHLSSHRPQRSIDFYSSDLGFKLGWGTPWWLECSPHLRRQGYALDAWAFPSRHGATSQAGRVSYFLSRGGSAGRHNGGLAACAVESRFSIRPTLQYREQSTNPSYTDGCPLQPVSRCPLTFIFRVADRRREAELPKFESNLIFPKPRR